MNTKKELFTNGLEIDIRTIKIHSFKNTTVDSKEFFDIFICATYVKSAASNIYFGKFSTRANLTEFYSVLVNDYNQSCEAIISHSTKGI